MLETSASETQQWPLYIIDSVDETKLSYFITQLLIFTPLHWLLYVMQSKIKGHLSRDNPNLHWYLSPSLYLLKSYKTSRKKASPRFSLFRICYFYMEEKWACFVESSASDVKKIISNTALESTQSYLIPKVSHLSSNFYFLAKYSFLDNLSAAYIFSWHTCFPKGFIYLIPLPFIDANFLGNFPLIFNWNLHKNKISS